MEPEFRLAIPQDLPAIHELETLVFPDPWSLEAFGDLPFGTAWVLEKEGKLLGYIIYLVALDEAVIINFGVDPKYQRQGYGRRLLKESMQSLIQRGHWYFYLDVRESNLPAIRLYQSLGFQSLGTRKNYYQEPPEDALVMGLYLINKEV